MIIGVDLGGTNIRAGVQKDGRIINRVQATLRDKDSLPSTLKQLIDTIRPLTKDPVRGIGIAVPSIVDTEKGIVFNVVNIPSWEKVELRKVLEDAFHIPVIVNNDANCFALGEQAFGEAHGYRHVLGVTLGTGVGSGVILNGKLYNGSNGGAGEVGYLPYLDRDFEFYCASAFFESVHHTTAHEASEAAIRGDLAALKIWDDFGVNMGALIKAILYAYDPEAVVFGGSISKAWGLFEAAMQRTLSSNFHFPLSMKKLKILQSKNEDIILLGATSLIE